MRIFAFLFLVLTAVPMPALARPMDDAPIAVLRVIDKMSARSSTLEVPVDKPYKLGHDFYFKVRACRAAPLLEAPESAAFIQVWENKPGAPDTNWIFSGWMFASKPSVSAMEHPIYDIWVIGCKGGAKSEPPPSTTPPAEDKHQEAPLPTSEDDPAPDALD